MFAPPKRNGTLSQENILGIALKQLQYVPVSGTSQSRSESGFLVGPADSNKMSESCHSSGI